MGAAQLANETQRLLDVLARAELRVEDVANDAVCVDHIRDPPGQESKRLGYAEPSAQLAIPVGQQTIGKLVFPGEPLMALDIVRADARDAGTGLGQRLVLIPEGAGLRRAAGVSSFG